LLVILALVEVSSCKCGRCSSMSLVYERRAYKLKHRRLQKCIMDKFGGDGRDQSERSHGKLPGGLAPSIQNGKDGNFKKNPVLKKLHPSPPSITRSLRF
ncbi:hypothetical protein T10_3395, partial [Trichinella papuae]